MAIRERLDRLGVTTEASESSSSSVAKVPIEVRKEEDLRGFTVGRRSVESVNLGLAVSECRQLRTTR
jgi:hypothetical protein